MLSRAQSATHNSATRVSANCSLSPGASAGSLGRGIPTGLAAAGGLSPQTAVGRIWVSCRLRALSWVPGGLLDGTGVPTVALPPPLTDEPTGWRPSSEKPE